MNIFIYNPNRLGSLDVLAPLALELKEKYPKLKVTTIYRNKEQYEILRKNTVLWNMMDEMGSILLLSREEESDFFNRFSVLAKLLLLSLNVLLSSKSVLLLKNREDRISRLLYKCNNLSGKTFSYMGSISPYEECLRRYFDENDNPREETAKLDRSQKDCCDGLISYGPENQEYLKRIGYYNLLYVGYPLMFPAFSKRMDMEAARFVESEKNIRHLEGDEMIITIFLNKFWGRWVGKTEEWAKESLQNVIRSYLNKYGKVIFYIRPHPMLREDRLLEFLAEFDQKQIHFTTLHPCLLSKISEAVVAIGESTTMTHVLGTGTPLIEYSQLRDDQKLMFPEGSLNAMFGTYPVADRDALDALLANPDVLKKNIAHFNKYIGDGGTPKLDIFDRLWG